MSNITGTNTSESLRGTDLPDTILGMGGNDILFGLGDNDQMDGGAGDDTLIGDAGNDTMKGGAGNDVLSYYNSTTGAIISLDGSVAAAGSAAGDIVSEIESITGSNTAGDELTGDAKGNIIYGNGGNDRLFGKGGADTLLGGLGADILNGGDGDDVMTGGGAGADAFIGGNGNDLVNYISDLTGAIIALDGSLTTRGAALGDTFSEIENLSGSDKANDTLRGSAATNVLYGNGGRDFLSGLAGADTLFGGKGNDILNGGTGDDTLNGGEGADLIEGGAGIDSLSYYFEAGAVISLDRSFNAAGSALGDRASTIENISGSNAGADKLAGSSASNTLYGNGGNDILYGRAGSDTLVGGAGKDKLDGGAGSDTASYAFDAAVNASLDRSIAGKGAALGDTFVGIENLSGSFTGNDRLSGDAGNNTLYGYGGSDKLYGRKGNDNILGGAGKDLLDGGDGFDQYYYFNPDEGGDTIIKFFEVDRIVVEGSAFGLGNYEGQIFDEAFLATTTNQAKTSNHRFVFDTRENSLWFDADGTGASAPKLLATFSQSLDIIKEYIFVI